MHNLPIGREVYSSESKSLGIVDYLRKDEVGTGIVQTINGTFGTNRLMSVDLSRLKDGRPIRKADILYEAAISAALDSLGVQDLRIISPEQAMGFMRSIPDHVIESMIPIGSAATIFVMSPPHYHLVSDIGVVITGLGTHEHVRNLDLYISYLLAQAKIKKTDLPAALFHLRAYPDSRFPYDVRLDYTEHSSWMPAPALIGKPFRTTKNQPVSELLVNGRDRGIELFGQGNENVQDLQSLDLEVWTGTSGDFLPLNVVCTTQLERSHSLGALLDLPAAFVKGPGKRIMLATEQRN